MWFRLPIYGLLHIDLVEISTSNGIALSIHAPLDHDNLWSRICSSEKTSSSCYQYFAYKNFLFEWPVLALLDNRRLSVESQERLGTSKNYRVSQTKQSVWARSECDLYILAIVPRLRIAWSFSNQGSENARMELLEPPYSFSGLSTGIKPIEVLDPCNKTNFLEIWKLYPLWNTVYTHSDIQGGGMHVP